MFKRQLLTTGPVLFALALTGCAAQQVWVPELEQAQKVYDEISRDPIVASLAVDELQSAKRQLEKAENAAASFRKPQNIAHESQIAQLQTLTAQQRARALTASHTVQTALDQNPLLSEQQVAAATAAPPTLAPVLVNNNLSPVMAAAMPGDSDIQAQLTALSQQLAALQAQLAGQAQLTEQAQPAIQRPNRSPAVNSFELQPSAQLQPATVQPIVELASKQVVPLRQTQPVYHPQNTAHPVIAAALPAYESDPVTSLPTASKLQHQLAAMNAKPGNGGMSLSLGERYFESGTASLMRQRAARHLDNVASVLSQNPSLRLNIEGHTDNQGSVQNNNDLSVNRAISLKSALVLRGISAQRISTRGYGQSQPVADNSSPLGRLQNRRVELIFPTGG